MKTVGEILIAAREKKGWSVEDLARRTKIQERFLIALETSAFEKLPEAPFVKGFIRTASVELGLDPDQLIAVFRRDYQESGQGQITPRSLEERVEKRWFWTPALTSVLVVGIVIVAFLAYLGIQLRYLSSPPRLTLASPKDRDIVSEMVVVEGKTDPTATVSVNEQEVHKNRNGVFSVDVELSPGTRTITVTAIGANRKTTTVERTVTVKGVSDR